MESLRIWWGELSPVNHQRVIIALIGAVTVLMRLPFLSFHGYYADLATYVQWGDRAVHDLGTLYTATGGGGFGFGGGQGVNYPPGMPYLFGVIVWLFGVLVSPAAHGSLDALIRSDGIGPFFAKIPILLADVAVVVVLYRQARRRHSERFALIVTAAYALSPAVLYDGAIWGQTDGLVALPLLVAIFALLDERYLLGGVSLALAVLLKPQPIIFVPLLLLYLWRWGTRRDFWRFTGAGAATVLVLCVPILVPHFQVGAFIANVQSQSYSATAGITSDAFNFWWAAGYGHLTLGSTIFGLPSAVVGDLLFGAVTVLVGVQIWQRREPVVLCFGLAMQLFGFFVFMGGQHERYLFLFIPLLAAALIVAPRSERQPLVVLYGVGTVLCLLNMVIGVGGGSFANSQMIPFVALPTVSAFLASSFDTLAMLLAFVLCGVFVYALTVYLRQSAAEAASRVAPAPVAEHVSV